MNEGWTKDERRMTGGWEMEIVEEIGRHYMIDAETSVVSRENFGRAWFFGGPENLTGFRRPVRFD